MRHLYQFSIPKIVQGAVNGKRTVLHVILAPKGEIKNRLIQNQAVFKGDIC
jgi:hypothetical protein